VIVIRKLGFLVLAMLLGAGPASLEAQAATTLQLYFSQDGGCGADTPHFILTTGRADGGECGSQVAGAKGKGLLLQDAYSLQGPARGKVDTTRRLTGHVFIRHFAIVSTTSDPVTLPGYVSVNVEIDINGTRVGSAHYEGIIPPNGAAEVNIDLKLPASLKGASLKQVAALVDYDTTVGFTGVSHSGATASVLTVPTR
jgi:hypothetical protein